MLYNRVQFGTRCIVIITWTLRKHIAMRPAKREALRYVKGDAEYISSVLVYAQYSRNPGFCILAISDVC